jgi:hypothetical protein
MDQVTLVSRLVEDGWRLIEQLVADGVEILAAAWLKPTEQERWILYIASAVVDQKGLNIAYRMVHAALIKTDISDLSTDNIRLIGSSDALTRQLQSIHRLRPSTRGIVWAGARLGDIQIDDAYIYPQTLPPAPGGQSMTTDEVLRKVTELMNRTGIAQPAMVALRNNTSFQGIPFGVEKNNDIIAVKFIETASGFVRSIPVADVASVT